MNEIDDARDKNPPQSFAYLTLVYMTRMRGYNYQSAHVKMMSSKWHLQGFNDSI
jgi:hypothetical protein